MTTTMVHSTKSDVKFISFKLKLDIHHFVFDSKYYNWEPCCSSSCSVVTARFAVRILGYWCADLIVANLEMDTAGDLRFGWTWDCFGIDWHPYCITLSNKIIILLRFK